MHGDTPKLLIIAKREVAGDLMPDFSGPGYVEAKKEIISGQSAKENGQLTGESGLADKLRALADKIDGAASEQKGHAEELLACADEVSPQYPSDDRGADVQTEECPPGSDEKMGAARELE
jgi:hypothetical protein